MRLKFVIISFAAFSLASCGDHKGMGEQPKIQTLQAPREAPAGSVSVEDLEMQLEPAPKVTTDLLSRGRERYDIHCSVCHSRTGEGDGVVVRRGFPAPLSFFTESQLALTTTQIVTVIRRGRGRMAGYATKILPSDQWAIANYVKALQLSRTFPESKLTSSDRAQLKEHP